MWEQSPNNNIVHHTEAGPGSAYGDPEDVFMYKKEEDNTTYNAQRQGITITPTPVKVSKSALG